MILELYAIKDYDSDTFENPFIAMNVIEAKHKFQEIVFERGNNKLSLYLVGEYDNKKGLCYERSEFIVI
jgi:hypothetical protein